MGLLISNLSSASKNDRDNSDYHTDQSGHDPAPHFFHQVVRLLTVEPQDEEHHDAHHVGSDQSVPQIIDHIERYQNERSSPEHQSNSYPNRG